MLTMLSLSLSGQRSRATTLMRPQLSRRLCLWCRYDLHVKSFLNPCCEVLTFLACHSPFLRYLASCGVQVFVSNQPLGYLRCSVSILEVIFVENGLKAFLHLEKVFVVFGHFVHCFVLILHDEQK